MHCHTRSLSSSGMPSRMPGQGMRNRVVGVYPQDPTAGYVRPDNYDNDDDDNSSDCISMDD
jgi:hypothetical protein